MALKNGAFVYMVRCSDGRYYIGIYRGFDLNTRIGEHNLGYYPKAWTFRRRPVELVWAEHFDRVTDAIDCETRIKKWSRAKKEALIIGDYALISELAKSRTAPADPSKRKFNKDNT